MHFTFFHIYSRPYMTSDQTASHPILQSVERASRRSLGMFAAGAGLGLTWGLARGASGSLGMYSLFIGGNCALVAFPCFAIREIIGTSMPDGPASLVSGAIGGFGAMAVFSGIRSAPKGALVFGCAGLTMETLNGMFDEWKLQKKEEILREREQRT